MRKPLSLKHKVIIPGRTIDLKHTDVKETFARVRREQARIQAEQERVVSPILKRKTGT